MAPPILNRVKEKQNRKQLVTCGFVVYFGLLRGLKNLYRRYSSANTSGWKGKRIFIHVYIWGWRVSRPENQLICSTVFESS